MQLRDILGEMEASMEKSASKTTTAPRLNPTKDDSRDVEKQAATRALARDLETGIDNLLAGLEKASAEMTEEEKKKEEDKKKSEKKEDKKEEKKEEKSGDSSAASGEPMSQEKEASTNLTEEDLYMLNKLASKGILQRVTEEQIMDHELSKQAGYQLALDTVARIIEEVGGSFEKSASVSGYHSAIDQCATAGHLKVCAQDMYMLKSAADTQIAQSYLDTLVSQGMLTSEGQALILNSLAQVAEINEETIAKAVAGLDPQQAAAAQQALMDQFVQRNTSAVPAGVPMMPAEQPQAVLASGAMGAPVLAPNASATAPEINHGPTTEGVAPVALKGPVEEQEKKAAAWDRYASDLIKEAQAFETLAAKNPELWAMVQGGHEKVASVDPVEAYFQNYLARNGYVG